MRIFTLFIGLLLSLPSLAEWQLNNEKSQFNLITTKATNVAEIHKFSQLKGNISKNGNVNFAIDLTSIDSNIAIRNERMQKTLFETNLFPQATFTATIDQTQLNNIKVGEVVNVDLTGDINLHGVKQKVSTQVQVIKLGQHKLIVNSLKPIIILAQSFNLGAGVEKLKSLAGLPSISNAVPVTFSLYFSH